MSNCALASVETRAHIASATWKEVVWLGRERERGRAEREREKVSFFFLLLCSLCEERRSSKNEPKRKKQEEEKSISYRREHVRVRHDQPEVDVDGGHDPGLELELAELDGLDLVEAQDQGLEFGRLARCGLVGGCWFVLFVCFGFGWCESVGALFSRSIARSLDRSIARSLDRTLFGGGTRVGPSRRLVVWRFLFVEVEKTKATV